MVRHREMLSDIMTCVVEVNEGVGNVQQGIAFLQAQVQQQEANFQLGFQALLKKQAAAAAPAPPPAPATTDSAALSGLVGQLTQLLSADAAQQASRGIIIQASQTESLGSGPGAGPVPVSLFIQFASQ